MFFFERKMGCLFLIKSTEIPTGYNPIITHKVKIGQHSGFTFSVSSTSESSSRSVGTGSADCSEPTT
ncbi:hypothetical protein HMPREF1554_00949 [Porphyromonas gingivalis F0569]|nr:hypothetical protein HMPREF1554_00949 [Porphyromonas gingivalis F0569]ERJ68279.1 hypothetical protein HMPREF1553_01119 [Porphyromonas gingivalis F0568]